MIEKIFSPLASYILLTLTIFGTGLDTSVGLNFLLLFMMFSTLNIFLNNTVKGTNAETSKIALPAKMFFASYLVLTISEVITTGQIYSGLRIMVNFAPVGLLLPLVILTQKNRIGFRSLQRAVVGVAILYAVFAAYEVWVLGVGRARFGYNPIPLGMIAVQFLFWSCISSQNLRTPDIEYTMGIIAAFWVVFLTGSRMPIFVAILIVLLWLLFGRAKRNYKLVSLVGVVTILPLQRFFNHEAYSVFVNRLASLLWWFDKSATIETASSSSGISRMEIWRVALGMIKDKPLLGWGSRQTLDQTVHATYGSLDIAVIHSHFHNEIIDLTVRFGLVGSLSVILAYLSVFWMAKNLKQVIVIALFLTQLFVLSLTDIIFIHSVTLSMFVISFLMMSLWVLSEHEK
ncbi:O-antigen ligase family protein [Celeribacter sp.]|uniref:O-antigen ligase family protein n=1 Tax=Celeribacter sp. TaxID=1890673 RepID=UPI003A8FF51D